MAAESSLVLGGNGFIGSHLVDALRAAGQRVRVLDAGAPRLDFDWGGIDYHQAGLHDGDRLGSALDGMQTVYHLISTTIPATSNQDPVSDIQQNLAGTVALMQAMMARGMRRIVFFSSGGTVYGNPVRLPVTEAHPLEPICSYGIVKVAVERYLLMYGALGQMDPLILRPGNPYGPRQSASGAQGVIPVFLKRVHAAQPVQIWGDGSAVRDYIYISDLVELAVMAGLGGQNGIFNAGSGEGHSLADILARISVTVGSQPVVQYLPQRRFDVDRLVLDICRTSEIFGWKPKVMLQEGLARTWASMRATA